ncbi:MAG: hypothetical protein QW270_08705 [Candidatus Bathyarchaeia archaeon]
MKLVRTYDGSTVVLARSVIDHVVRKHSEVLSLLNLDKQGFVKLLHIALKEPNEAYTDAYQSKYFLKKLNNLYLNVVVSEGTVKTAYLISWKTYSKMRKKRWLQRLC